MIYKSFSISFLALFKFEYAYKNITASIKKINGGTALISAKGNSKRKAFQNIMRSISNNPGVKNISPSHELKNIMVKTMNNMAKDTVYEVALLYMLTLDSLSDKSSSLPSLTLVQV